MWIWGVGEDVPGRPVAEYDDAASSVSGWRLCAGGEDAGIDGSIVFRVPGTKLAKVLSYWALPAGSVALVRGVVLEALRELPEEEIAFHQASVKCTDGVTGEFTVARPKIERVCTDVDRSDVSWERPNDFYVMWKFLKFLPGSMGSHSIVRERYNRQIIVSDALKSTLSMLEPQGIDFARPEDSRRGYAPWV